MKTVKKFAPTADEKQAAAFKLAIAYKNNQNLVYQYVGYKTNKRIKKTYTSREQGTGRIEDYYLKKQGHLIHSLTVYDNQTGNQIGYYCNGWKTKDF